MTVPERLSWAVDQLDVQPGDHILEIGCGRGVAAALICDRLDDGRITATDRSATATSATEQRVAAHIRAGKAAVHTVALEDLDLPGETFDKIFAVNVNLFWTSSARRELELIGRLLRPGGALYLFYEPPAAEKAHTAADTITTSLGQAGFTAAVTIEHARSSAALLCILAQPGAETQT